MYAKKKKNLLHDLGYHMVGEMAVIWQALKNHFFNFKDFNWQGVT